MSEFFKELSDLPVEDELVLGEADINGVVSRWGVLPTERGDLVVFDIARAVLEYPSYRAYSGEGWWLQMGRILAESNRQFAEDELVADLAQLAGFWVEWPEDEQADSSRFTLPTTGYLNNVADLIYEGSGHNRPITFVNGPNPHKQKVSGLEYIELSADGKAIVASPLDKLTFYQDYILHALSLLRAEPASSAATQNRSQFLLDSRDLRVNRMRPLSDPDAREFVRASDDLAVLMMKGDLADKQAGIARSFQRMLFGKEPVLTGRDEQVVEELVERLIWHQAWLSQRAHYLISERREKSTKS